MAILVRQYLKKKCQYILISGQGTHCPVDDGL